MSPNSEMPPATSDRDETRVRARAKPAVREWVIPIVGPLGPACVAKVEKALLAVEGVSSAGVDPITYRATVVGDPGQVRQQALYRAIQKTAYQSRPESDLSLRRRSERRHPRLSATGFGVVAAAAVIGFYLGLITLTSDWFNAKAQFADYGWWVTGLGFGLGLQVGLFAYMRSALADAHLRGAASGMVASGGMSGVAMALCCSHYLAAVLPAIGLPFLSASVVGLADYQTPFFSLGALSNLFGLAYMLRLMRRNGVWDVAAFLGNAVAVKNKEKEAAQ